MATERKTIKTYVADGTQTTFSFSFDYIKKSFVYVKLGTAILTQGTAYTVVNRQIVFSTAPTGTLTIYRVTPTDRIVTWSDTSVLRATDMTIQETQLLHLAEETADKVGTDVGELVDQALEAASSAELSATNASRSATQAASLMPLILSGDALKTIRVKGDETGFELVHGMGGQSLVLIAHSNTYVCTAATDYTSLIDAKFIHDSFRTQKALKLAVIEKGNGNCRVTVTDGTHSVNVVGINKNSAAYAVQELEIDCSTLTTGILWTVTLEGKAVGGEYEARRFSIQADPANILGGYPLILADPSVNHSTSTPTVVDTKYFPINWAIDNQCAVKVSGLLTLVSGTTTTVMVRLTTTSSTGSYTTEEKSATLTATGYFDLLIAFPSTVAPYVKTEVFLSTDGQARLDHYEAWLEV